MFSFQSFLGLDVSGVLLLVTFFIQRLQHLLLSLYTSFNYFILFNVFTALHSGIIQHEAVRPSVCPSNV